MKRTIYVGLPCYNEEKDINQLIDRLLDVKKRIKKEFEYNMNIFCVNDGSKDKTKNIILKRKKDNIKLINHNKNKGLGEAMKTIINEFNNVAKEQDVLIVMDADNTHNPMYIIDLIKKMENDKSDIIIASRYQKGANITGLKKHRILISDMAKIWYSLMLRIPKVKDYTCGYRLYTYNVINEALKKYGNDIISQTSFACMMELLYKLHLNGATVSEIPFSLEYEKKTGESKLKILKTIKDSLITTIKIKKKNNIIPYIIIFLITISLLSISSSTLKNVGLIYDPAVYLNVARNVLNGKVLYTEIVDNKGPILYFINALFLKLGQNGIIILEFLLIFITFLYLYKTIKLINNNKFQRILLIILSGSYLTKFFTYGLSCEEYALCFSSIGLYLCIKYYKNNFFTKKQCILLGILCAMCFFIRQNLVVIFAGFALGILIKLIIEKKYKELFKYILFALIGFLIVTAPILIYLIKNNCFNEYIEFTFLHNITLNKLGYIKSLITIYLINPLATIIILTNLILLIYKIIKKKELKHLGIVFTIIITILFNIISAKVYNHYLIIFIPIILLSYNELFNIKYIKNYIFTILISIAIIFNIYTSKDNFHLTQPNEDVIKYIKNNSSKNDKIAILGFHDEIYYLSQRESVSKYTYILNNNAFSTENHKKMIKEYIKDIINKKPLIIIEDNYTMKYSIKPYIDLKEYNSLIQNKYKRITIDNTKTIYKLKKQ